MKKILLAASALIATTGLYSSTALADTPVVTLGGYSNFEAGYAVQDMDNRTAAGGTDSTHANQRPQAFRNDDQIDVKINGKSDAFAYGGEIDLLADTTTDVQGRGFNASKTFVYLQCAKTGMRLELGSNVGADGAMKVDAGTIAHATGGIDGDWSYFANAREPFVAQTDLPLGYGNLEAATQDYLGNHTEENLNKITLYTPRYAGFQAGVSYLPDQTNTGQGTALLPTPNPAGPNRTKNNAGLSANIVTGGISYDHKFGDVGIAAAVTGEEGKAQNRQFDGLEAWNAGAKATYKGASLAGSYGNWGSSNNFKAAHSKDTWYWDIGAAYETGPWGASITYMQSQFDCGTGAGAGNNEYCTDIAPSTYKNKFSNVSIGADYKLAPGLTPYAEVSFFDENAGDFDARDNKGTVTLLGTQLNF